MKSFGIDTLLFVLFFAILLFLLPNSNLENFFADLGKALSSNAGSPTNFEAFYSVFHHIFVTILLVIASHLFALSLALKLPIKVLYFFSKSKLFRSEFAMLFAFLCFFLFDQSLLSGSVAFVLCCVFLIVCLGTRWSEYAHQTDSQRVRFVILTGSSAYQLSRTASILVVLQIAFKQAGVGYLFAKGFSSSDLFPGYFALLMTTVLLIFAKFLMLKITSLSLATMSK